MPQLLTVSQITSDSRTEFPHPIDSTYVERFWLPLVGPAVLAVARHLHWVTTHAPYPDEVPIDVLGAECGISRKRIRGTLDRANKFRFVQFIPETGRLAVYERVRWAGTGGSSYPASLAAEHEKLRRSAA